MRAIPFIFLFLVLIACVDKGEQLTAQKIIDKSIQWSCNGYCENVSVEFMFRERKYVRIRNGGLFDYRRITYADEGVITDILSNDGFKRLVNDTLVQIPDSMAMKYSNSVNSVHYFSQLPFGLNDKAVNKKLVGTDTIKGNLYYQVQVTFDKEGGGKDFEDVFIFWVEKEDFSLDYFAYEYFTDDGGIRFREAYNERIVNGIRFLDYNNYKPGSKDTDLLGISDQFEEGSLELLSKIEIEDIRVNLKNDMLIEGQ